MVLEADTLPLVPANLSDARDAVAAAKVTAATAQWKCPGDTYQCFSYHIHNGWLPQVQVHLSSPWVWPPVVQMYNGVMPIRFAHSP